MKLRILRRYSKQLDCHPMDVRYGGPNPMKIVNYDTLQYFNEATSEWIDVPIIEEKELN